MNSNSNRVLVWDWPTRIFHGLLALSFIGAYVTAENDPLRLVHVTLGYTVGGLIVFRLIWGLAGTRHARFANFVRGPAAVLRYLRSLVTGQPEHHTGHNPAGALAILALLALGLLLVAAGWATYNEVGGHDVEELHEGLANAMLLLVGVHVAAVLLSSYLHRENLARAMLTGYKQGEPGEGIRHAWRALGALLLLVVLGFWGVQWFTAPQQHLAHDAVHGLGHDDERDADD